ncbi:MAG: hypothetical protein LBB47_08295 [Spirochaetaceae bacterium]|nr:hypothetical protein [Spirochaetaceae bacterium]
MTDGGQLVIDGAYNARADSPVKANAALVTVSGGVLNLEDGVALQNNYNNTGNGGGVYVDHGTFTMDYGTISGNTAHLQLAAVPLLGILPWILFRLYNVHRRRVPSAGIFPMILIRMGYNSGGGFLSGIPARGCGGSEK